jgi:hypothetical protein
MKTKQIFLFFILISVSFIAFSQDEQRPKWREDINAQRVAFITSKMNLTAEEAQKFWPLFNEYYDKKEAIQNEKIALLKKFRDKKIAPNEMDATLDKLIQFNKTESALLEEYSKKLKQVISTQKVIKLYIAQEEFMKFILNQLKARNQKRMRNMDDQQ